MRETSGDSLHFNLLESLKFLLISDSVDSLNRRRYFGTGRKIANVFMADRILQIDQELISKIG